MAKTNMLRIFGLFLALNTMTVSALIAQNKALTASQKINDKTRQAKEDSDEINRQVAEAGENLNSVKANVKTVVSVFEPILHLRLKKRSTAIAGISGNEPSDSDNTSPDEGYQSGVTQTDINNGAEITAENEYYNTDGSANLGSQNNDQYGCYLDMVAGQVMDDIDAAGNSKNIDLIFTATGAFNEQVPMYAFLTPAYVKNDRFAYNFFKGTKFKDQNIPPASWDEVNESEVAMTALTPAQFEKIQNNNQLTAVVKQIRGFGQKVESRTKLDGKVLAVKTEMGNRTAYGLVLIQNHYGTIGSNGYLKIKLKVTGFDSNGDGTPDASKYINY